MPTVRVRNKHQITIPTGIMQQANLHPNDLLEACYHNGAIILVPARPVSRRDSIMEYAGIGRTSYGQTSAEVDECLSALRTEWE